MPITLGCPSCMKRFRARDESAGKKVKCPYCGAAVSVPTAEEAAASAAPTMALPPPPPPATKSPFGDSGTPPVPTPRQPSPPPAPAPVATPDDWGAGEPPSPKPQPPRFDPPPAATAPAEDTGGLNFSKPKPGSKPAPSPKRGVRPDVGTTDGPKTPDQIAAPQWRKVKAGLGWVLFGLFFLALPGFVGFAKTVYPRATQEELPTGEGWVSIPGYVNSPETGAVKMTKMQQLDVVLYALPVVLGGLFISLGRMTAGAAPRSSGAKGMFACSGLFSLLALAALLTAAVTDKLLLKQTYFYTAVGFLVLAGSAEFWFLTALAASGVALKRPRAARAVGTVGFVFMLAAVIPTIGWHAYYQELRPKPANDDWLLYEQSGVMLGWLLLIGVYWRAVSSVRGAIAEFLENVPE